MRFCCKEFVKRIELQNFSDIEMSVKYLNILLKSEEAHREPRHCPRWSSQ